MTLEDRLNSLKEAFTGKTAEVEAKAGEITSLTAQVAELTEGLAAKEASIVDLSAKLADMSAKLALAETIQAEACKKVADITATQETAGKKAAQIAASVGVTPVEVNPAIQSAQAKSDDEIAQEWAGIAEPKAKSDFYTKNRTAILRAAGL